MAPGKNVCGTREKSSSVCYVCVCVSEFPNTDMFMLIMQTDAEGSPLDTGLLLMIHCSFCVFVSTDARGLSVSNHSYSVLINTGDSFIGLLSRERPSEKVTGALLTLYQPVIAHWGNQQMKTHRGKENMLVYCTFKG